MKLIKHTLHESLRMSDAHQSNWPQRIARSVQQFFMEEDGPTAVEYAVMLALILIACLGSIGALADATGSSFGNSSRAIDEAINR